MKATSVLYLCEKPSQARTLAKELEVTTKTDGAFIGDGVIVTWCYGHMQSLAMPEHYLGNKAWSISDLPVLPQHWQWKLNDKCGEQFNLIGKFLSQANEVVIATDPDDEGEVIGRQVLSAHRFEGKVSRLWLSALDSGSIKSAISNPMPIAATDSLYRAGLMRRKLDWLFGTNLTRAYSVVFDRTIHVGRVKSRLLSELTKRECEIADFRPVESYRHLVRVGDMVFEGTSAPARSYFTCLSCTDEEVSIEPPAPYNLSSLLAQACDAGISLSQAYNSVQLLYEAGAISYPRTSSTSMPGSNGEFAAHHAIVPLRDDCQSWFDPDSRFIFNLVRFNSDLQSLGPARAMQRTSRIECAGSIYQNQSIWIEDTNMAGWLLCEPNELNKYSSTPQLLNQGEQLLDYSYSLKKDVTVPKSHFTEASLLRHMAANDIGTEATRVEAISNITKGNIATLMNGYFVPTAFGNFVSKIMPSSISGNYMEELMDEAVGYARNNADDSAYLVKAAKWVANRISEVATPA